MSDKLQFVAGVADSGGEKLKFVGPSQVGDCNVLLGGLLKSQNLLSHSLGKVDKSELALVKEVVLPALVDDAYEIVLCCSSVGQDSIDLTEDQRGFVPLIFEAQRKLFRRLLHGLSK